MGLIIAIFLFILAIAGIYFLYKFFKWIFQEKVRTFWMLIVIIGIVVSIAIRQLFFVKMGFEQSNVYPDLYLIKNPVEDPTQLNKAIKEFIFQKINGDAINERENHQSLKNYRLRFYEYSKGDFGESGTAYFLDHKERRDGMTAELLEYYPEYQIAEFNVVSCKNDRSKNYGNLVYYKQRSILKIDTLFNSCKK